MFLTDQGCLLRKTESGESHLLLVVFLRQNGLKNILARRQAKPTNGQQLPDLFECGDFSIEQKDNGRPAFLKEYTRGTGFPDIARSYARLTAASRLSRFYERNLLHLEEFAPAWDLLLQAFSSMAGKPSPETVLLKALYRFARAEGYAVQAQWLEGLAPAKRNRVLELLAKPVGEATAGTAEIEEWTRHFCRFLEESTDLLPPDL